MRIPPETSLTAERGATKAMPQPLPRPEGDRRVQAALDNDRYFRRYILAAFIVAAANKYGDRKRQADPLSPLVHRPGFVHAVLSLHR